MEIEYSKTLKHVLYHKDNYNLRLFAKSLVPEQWESKQWLVDELLNIPVDFKCIQLLGGWYGYPLIQMLSKHYDIELLENVDIGSDELKICKKYANVFSHKFVRTRCEDASIASVCDKKMDLVINASQENMDFLPELIKNKEHNKNCVFVLQNNNQFTLWPDNHPWVSDENNSCVNSADELAAKSGLSVILYSGTKVFKNYERYMVIGLK